MTVPALKLETDRLSSVAVLMPTIAPAARDLMAGEIALGLVEVSFIATFDEATRTITSARLMARGNPSSAPVIMTDLRSGDVVLHNHPHGPLFPSEADMTLINLLAPQGIGFGIINDTATTLFLAREPRLPWQWYERPAVKSKSRHWFFWRFGLTYQAPYTSSLPPIGKAL